MQSIVDNLNKIAEYQAQRDLLQLDKQALIDSLLTPEIKAKLAEIEAEFADQAQTVDANIAALTDEVKAEMVACGKTVKAGRLQAVYVNGSNKWNNDALLGFMAAGHPELAAFYVEGKPGVQIRVVK